MKLLSARLAAALFLLALPLGIDCTASLDEDCRGGTCGTASSATGLDPSICKYPDTHGFPCDVYTVLHENCHTCHVEPPLNHAPFSLATYADTQLPFGSGATRRWQRMAQVVEPGALPQMPFGKAVLSDDKLNVLRAWFAACTNDGVCPTGPDGGTGGAGATSSASSSSSQSASSSGSAGGGGGMGGAGTAGGAGG